jgi:hypothetical protein
VQKLKALYKESEEKVLSQFVLPNHISSNQETHFTKVHNVQQLQRDILKAIA